MRKLTHEEFLDKFYKQNKHANDIEVLGTYITRDTKIKCKCKIDGYEWEVIPKSLLNGHGCPKCAGKVKPTQEEFIAKVHKVNPDIEVLGTYINNHTKIKCKCKIDGYEWEATPNHLLKGHGCPKCGGVARPTHEEFMERLQQVNPDIEVLGTYKNNKTKIKCKCKICGHEWSTTPNSVLRSVVGCPKCGFKRTKESITKTHTQFMHELYEKNTHAQDIEILDTYIKDSTKLKCKCKIDGHEWEATPNNLLRGYGCPECGGTAKFTHEKFINRFNKQNTRAHDIEILGTYINYQTKIKCRCKVCGHEWETKPLILLMGSGCPKCNTSKGEKRISQYLDKLGIDYIYDKRYFNDLVSIKGSLLRPDFIIPSLKIWIEYDGIQHYEPKDFSGTMSEEQLQEQFKIVQQNDQIKNQYAKDNNWTLIRIPFTEYDNIEQILAAYIEQEQVI